MKRTTLGHRIGALLLAIVMMLSILPVTAFAADGEPDETTEVIETEAPETEVPETEETEAKETEETEAEETEAEETEAEETEAEETEAEETEAEETEETVEETTEETMDVEFLDEDIEPLYVENKPAGGETQGQPFKSGTGGSTYFRIPAMVTLKDGTIVAATDARWNQMLDNGGNDTIVSYSKDNGATWRYTFANYMGDNGNEYNANSTCFIDPALATDGSTVYMLVTLFPGGRALSNGADGRPDSGDPFNDDGTLKLKKRGEDSYNYYLDGYQIYSNDGTAVNYAVDENFGNLFYRNADYQVMPTTYLCLTKSTDGGASWSDPRLLDVKNPDESFYGVGPGRGLVTSTGRIIFPCYTNPNEHTSFIYSDNKGETWHRTAEFADYSSETTLVEADGKLYAFFRCSGTDYQDIPYYVSNDNGSTWTRGPKNSQIDPCTSCQMNAITYSQKIDGKTAILLSCPTGSSRENGKIFVGLVNGDNTLTWKYASDVISSKYAYSCLTELNDGSVALLAETGNGVETFKVFGIQEIAKGATIGGEPVDPTEPPVEEDKTVADENGTASVTAPGLTGVTVEIVEQVAVPNAEKVVAYDVTPTTDEGEYTGEAVVKLTIPEDWDSEKVKAFIVNSDDSITTINGSVEGDKYMFTAPHFSVMGLYIPAAAAENQENVDLLIGGTTTKTQKGVNNAENVKTDRYDSSIAKVSVTGTDAVAGEPTYEYVSANCSDLIQNDSPSWQKTNHYYRLDGNYYPVYAKRTSSGYAGSTKEFTWGYSTDNGANVTEIRTQTSTWWADPKVNITVYILSSSTDPVPASTTIAIEGLKAGKTYYTVGDIEYVITVTDPNPVDPPDPTDPPVEEKVMDVTLVVGQSKTFHDFTGAYTPVGTGEGIAKVEYKHVETTAGAVEVQQIMPGSRYLIVQHANGAVLTQNISGDSGAYQAGPTLGPSIADVTESTAAPYLWTFEQSANGQYLIKGADGQYITFTTGRDDGAGYNVGLTNNGSPMTVAYNENAGVFAFYATGTQYWGNKIYLHNHGQTACGWYDVSEHWRIYEMKSSESMTTDVTFTGISVGTTTVKVGNTTYNIHVTDKIDADNSPVVAGEGKGNGKVVTKLNLTVGVNFDLNLGNGYEGKNVTWSSANDGIAAVDANGVVNGVSVGETIVTATIDGVPYKIPVVVHPNGSGNDIDTTGNKHINIYVSEIEDTEVFYSLTAIPQNSNTMSAEMVPTQEGEVFYLNYPGTYKIAFDFFGRPDEGYALTRMSATDTAGDYMALQDKNNPNNCDFFTKTSAAGYNQRGTFGGRGGTGDTQVANVVRAALDKDCDGGMGFTRGSDGSHIDSDLTFRSEKLPEVDKEVYGILPKDGKQADFRLYEPGMTAEVGDRVYFKVTVSKRDYEDAVDFENMILAEQLAGAEFVVGEGVGNPDGTEKNLDNTAIGSGSKTEWDTDPAHTQSFFVGYTIKEEDLDSTIINTVKLDYRYKSKFSSGSFGGTAEADAQISATDFKPKDIVIDFGLPVELDFTDEIHGQKILIKGEANYGDVTLNENDKKKITYTPKQVLPEADTVTLTLQKGNANEKENTFEVTFKVYPASNVLYEAEDFMTNPPAPSFTSWEITPNAGLGKQSSANEAPYGYDTAYVNNTDTNGSWNQTITSGKTTPLTTSFYGDTFDLIGTCGPDTGTVLLKIKSTEGKRSRSVIIDTSFNDSYGTISQVPWAHAVMPSGVGNYNVEVIGYYRTVNTSASSFGTFGAGVNDTLYAIMDDLEAEGFDLNEVEYVYFDEASPLAQMENSTMMTLAEEDAAPAPTAVTAPIPGGRIVVDGFRVYTGLSYDAYVENEQNAAYINVLDAVMDTSKTTVAYIEGGEGDPAQKADYQKNGGPQNEVYLANNQAVAFKVTPGATVQISLRAVKAGSAWNGQSITSNTEMYYTVTADEDGLITIKNTADSGLLALGNIKGNVQPMTEADIQLACAKLSGPVDPVDPPVEPEEPEEPEIFSPDWFKAKAKSTKLMKKKHVAVNVTTSTDVEYITVNGQRVTGADLEKQGNRDVYVFTYQEDVDAKAKPTYEIIAYNANGMASEPISVKG